MEKVPPKLTVAIPTYNSISYLPKVIESLLTELSDINPNLVEILISDNGSKDGTFDYLVKKNLPENFNLFQNSENLGFESQIRKLTNQARGEFLWTLGSQDYVNPGSLSLILERLNRHDGLTHCILNFSIEHEDSNFQNISHQYTNVPTKATKNIYSFFRFLGGPALALSGNLVKTSFLKEVQNSELICRNWAHLELIYLSIFQTKLRKEFHFINEPVFTLYREKNGWWTTNAVLEVYIELYKLLSNRISIPLIRWHQQYRKNGKFLNRAIENARFTVGLNISEELYKSIFQNFRNFPTFWIFTYLNLRNKRAHKNNKAR